jgi:hypothetical protein
MSKRPSDTEILVERAQHGDEAASHELLARFQERLLRMVGVRLDRPQEARADPADIFRSSGVIPPPTISDFNLGALDLALASLAVGGEGSPRSLRRAARGTRSSRSETNRADNAVDPSGSAELLRNGNILRIAY